MINLMRGKIGILIKRAFQELLRRRGLRLTYNREDSWPAEVDILDLLVAWRFADSHPRMAMQVGANDGHTDDPLRPLIERYAMNAVLVEPLPEPYEKLAATYARSDLVHTIQAAIDTTSGHRDIWRVLPTRPGLEEFSPISSFDRAIAEKHHQRYSARGGSLSRERVMTISVRDLMQDGNVTLPIDILQVDTEGHDAVIVHEFLHAGVHPIVINYEHIHLSGTEDATCRRSLHQRGYRLLRYGRDTAAVLPKPQSSADNEWGSG